MRRSLAGRRVSQKGAQMVELSGIMIYLQHKCVICYQKLTRENVGPACIKHAVDTCYKCVMKLRRTKKPCPICRERLINDTDAQKLNMSWDEFLKWLDEQMDA